MMKCRGQLLLLSFLYAERNKNMHKILLKYNGNKDNLFELYGTTTTVDGTSTFKAFETDDVTVLKAEVEKLDAKYGNQNVSVISDVTVTYAATIVEDTTGGDVTEPTV